MRNTRSLGVSAFCMGSSSPLVWRGANGNVRPGTAFFSRGFSEERTLESAHPASATENLLRQNLLCQPSVCLKIPLLRALLLPFPDELHDCHTCD